MKFTKNSILLLVLILAITFSSCISINRNIKVNKDGSGTETMTIKFSQMFYAMMASMSSMMDSSRRQGFLDSLYSDQIFIEKTKEKFDTMSGIKLIDMYAIREPDSSNSFVIKYDFDNLLKIGNSLEGISTEDNASQDTSDNTTVIYEKKGNEIFFNYIYKESTPKDVTMSDSARAEMRKGMAELFKGGNFSFEIEFPYEVVSTNAQRVDGSKLGWDFTISDMMTTGIMNIEAVLKEN